MFYSKKIHLFLLLNLIFFSSLLRAEVIAFSCYIKGMDRTGYFPTCLDKWNSTFSINGRDLDGSDIHGSIAFGHGWSATNDNKYVYRNIDPPFYVHALHYADEKFIFEMKVLDSQNNVIWKGDTDKYPSEISVLIKRDGSAGDCFNISISDCIRWFGNPPFSIETYLVWEIDDRI